jgi:hypothetical protein
MSEEEKLEEIWKKLVGVEAKIALLQDMLDTKKKIEDSLKADKIKKIKELLDQIETAWEMDEYSGLERAIDGIRKLLEE